ncbi:hypothetical protein BDZ89DRAFT_1138468 [Hymenopellis radicata]|nr:hypothetical protein BDZ89DRAFT_1138468 [Hymenopellis radicata]
MPAAAERTVHSRGAAARTSRSSRAASRTPKAPSDPSPGLARRKTPTQVAADRRKRQLETEAFRNGVLERNAALQAAEDGAHDDDNALEAGYTAPHVAVAELDDDEEDGLAGDLPPSDVEEDNSLPVASSDPIDFEDSEDDIVVSSAGDPFATPTKARKRRRGSDDDEGGPPKGAKVTKAQITPRSARFATDVRRAMVRVTATENPYPGVLNRLPFALSLMREVVAERAGDTDYAETLERLEALPEKLQLVQVWILYARGGFMNAMSRVCREQLGSLGIPGSMTPPVVIEVVTWLLKDEAWKFGGLDIAKREFNRSAPFAAAFFEAVPRALFMEGRGKANSETFRFLIELQKVPLVLMALTMTAVEHCLGEWRDGTQRRADFREEASVRYLHHLAGLEHVVKKAPQYMFQLQSALFKSIAYPHE